MALVARLKALAVRHRDPLQVHWTEIRPEDVMQLQHPVPGYLCPWSANASSQLEFLSYEIKEPESGQVVFSVGQDAPATDTQLPDELPPELEDAVRSVQYTFPAAFLHYKAVRATLEFRVGGQAIEDLRIVERHYFQGKLVRSYDFRFGFVIPNSINTWESMYDVPQLDANEAADYVRHPFAHTSDSFFFAGNKLIIHNKAAYQYQ